MKSLVTMLSAAALVAGFWTSSAFAQGKTAPTADSTHSGTFVSAAAGKLVMTDAANKEHSHMLAKEAKLTLDGKTATVDAFKKGMHLKVTTDKSGSATAVAAETVKPVTTKRATKAAAKTAPAKAPVAATGK